MAKSLEISVPDAVHDALSLRAEQQGVSVEQLVARELEKQVVAAISPDELRERLQRLGSVDLGDLTAADLIREGREERTDQIIDAISRR